MMGKSLMSEKDGSIGSLTRSRFYAIKPMSSILKTSDNMQGEFFQGTKGSVISLSSDLKGAADLSAYVVTHEFGHALDGITSGGKLSRALFKRFKAFSPGEYSNTKVKGIIRKPGEWFAEIYALFATKSGRKFIQEENPDLYFAMRKVFQAKNQDDLNKVIRSAKLEQNIFRIAKGGVVGGVGTAVYVRRTNKKNK